MKVRSYGGVHVAGTRPDGSPLGYADVLALGPPSAQIDIWFTATLSLTDESEL
ncbi:hypothetical protein [Rhodococcus jostii]|uniref:hypothetical protein n=1 Tax=Rhodococcus jostii TaxID=132919 RepID=UPI003630DC44